MPTHPNAIANKQNFVWRFAYWVRYHKPDRDNAFAYWEAILDNVDNLFWCTINQPSRPKVSQVLHRLLTD